MVKEENASFNFYIYILHLSDTPNCFTYASWWKQSLKNVAPEGFQWDVTHYAESQCNRFIYENNIESYLPAPYKNQQIFTWG